MSHITQEQVKKIAKLARIAITEEEAGKMAPEFSNILGWIEQLGEVNTDDVAPLASVVDAKLIWRADKITDGNIQSDVLANAPEEAEGFYVVPKVVE